MTTVIIYDKDSDEHQLLFVIGCGCIELRNIQDTISKIQSKEDYTVVMLKEALIELDIIFKYDITDNETHLVEFGF